MANPLGPPRKPVLTDEECKIAMGIVDAPPDATEYGFAAAARAISNLRQAGVTDARRRGRASVSPNWVRGQLIARGFELPSQRLNDPGGRRTNKRGRPRSPRIPA